MNPKETKTDTIDDDGLDISDEDVRRWTDTPCTIIPPDQVTTDPNLYESDEELADIINADTDYDS